VAFLECFLRVEGVFPSQKSTEGGATTPYWSQHSFPTGLDPCASHGAWRSVLHQRCASAARGTSVEMEY
jgi:hypothetical protein